ncbi:HlyD family efflux transporter periplasmic adaptor subunit [Patescibacteria group bacterium]|nr:HlyD family efflux transporter periplasmic adaptor subunit [Patescibacteria group bacterium]
MEEKNNQILNAEKKILYEEKKILAEIKHEEGVIKRMVRNVWVATGIAVFIIVGGFAGVAYWNVSNSRVAIDKAEISAPIIELAPQNSGILQEVFVREGDEVPANASVAQVGNELVKTKVDGVVISVKNDIGKIFNRGEAVVTMIDPTDLRVEARIEEDKGLKDIHVGERAVFTADAFGSKEYEGVVDEVSPTSLESGVVFTISDKRAVKEFVVKVRFDRDLYPELKNGMSAKIWIYK